MEIELKKMFDTVQNIHNEMYYLRERRVKLKSLKSISEYYVVFAMF